MKEIADVLVVTKQTVIKFLNVSEGVSATFLFFIIYLSCIVLIDALWIESCSTPMTKYSLIYYSMIGETVCCGKSE